MKEDLTDISVIQDKSGSMDRLRDETISSYNAFVEEQKNSPGRCLISLTQFDTTNLIRYAGIPIADAQPLTRDTYKPNGYTALHDAIGTTIVATGKRLEAMPEAARPARVVIVIITDGEENSSREYTREQVFEMIKTQTEVFNWQFIFLGAKQDALVAGRAIGVGGRNAMSAGITGQSVQAAYAAVSSNIRDYRAGNTADVDKLAFKKAQREDQLKEGAAKDALNQ